MTTTLPHKTVVLVPQGDVIVLHITDGSGGRHVLPVRFYPMEFLKFLLKEGYTLKDTI